MFLRRLSGLFRLPFFLLDPHRGENGDLGEIRVCGAQLKRWRWHPFFSNGFWFQRGFPVAKCDSMKACDIYLFALLPVSERILTTPKCSLQ